jgi:hypothetical protein
MLPDANLQLIWLAIGATEIFCNQSNLFSAKHIYSSIYTFLESSGTICLRPPSQQALLTPTSSAALSFLF